MNMTTALKGLLMMSVQHKIRETSREDIYGYALYLPVIYFFVAAPTFLSVGGFSLFALAGIGWVYPQYSLPLDFILALASGATFAGAAVFLTYRGILKRFLVQVAVPQKVETLIAEKVSGTLAPIIQQFRAEQGLLKQALIDFK